MRKSSKISLGLLATASLTLVACGPSEKDSDHESFLPDQAACEQTFSSAASDACRAIFTAAEQEHQRTAPRYVSQEQCQNATGGACVTQHVNGIGNIIIPAMAGVLIGRMIAGAPDNSRPVLPVYSMPPNNNGNNCPPGVTPRPGETSCNRSGGGGTYFFYYGNTMMGSSSPSTSGPSNVGSGASRVTMSDAGRSVINTKVTSGQSVARGGLGGTGRAFSSTAS